MMKNPLSSIANWWHKTVESDVILRDYKGFKDFDCLFRGFPSTSSETTDIYESGSTINYLPFLQYEGIKFALEELNKFISNQFQIPAEIEWHSVNHCEQVKKLFKNANKFALNIGFLWAAFLKKSDLLSAFLDLGAQLSFFEPNYGLTALHLAAFSGCLRGTEYLLNQKECYVNLMCKSYSPLHCAAFSNNSNVVKILLEKGANIDALTNDVYCNLEGVLHCAIRANAIDCVNLLSSKGANVNLIDNAGRTPIHLAAELGRSECLRILIRIKGANIDQQTKVKRQTPLHFAALQRHQSCLDILLECGASSNISDYNNKTPLHLATQRQCNECVKLLLKKGNSNPNAQDTSQRTALHSAVSRSTGTNSAEILKTLIRFGGDVNAKDIDEFTPLHLAANNELSDCVEVLILNNADITAKCKAGVTALGIICRKTPNSIDAIRKKLDETISFNYNPATSKVSELQINFFYILQNCYPKEIDYLNTLLEEGQKELLLHPTCRAFLHLKWKKIKKFFIFRAICAFLLVALMSTYMIMGLARHCYNFSKNITVTTYENDKELCINHSLTGKFIVEHRYIIELEWYLMMIINVGFILRKLSALPGYSSIGQYFSTQNLLDWGTAITVFLISFVYTGRTYLWQNHVSAFGILLVWINFLYILGEFPFFGTYVAMYSSVQREFAKLLLLFSCLLIGFTISFCILFPSSEVFSSIYIGFITVLVMAIGEVNLDIIANPTQEETLYNLNGSMQIIYATFVTCVTIILLNLLVGIAVHDIQGLKKSAKLTKLTKTTELISRIEKALFTDYFHRKILTHVFRWDTVISNNGHLVMNVKINQAEKRLLPFDVLQSAYEIARKHKKKNKTNFRKTLINVKEQLKKNSSNNNTIISGDDNNNNNGIISEKGELNEVKNHLRNLSDELINIRGMMESNQRLMEQILRVINSRDE